MRDSYGSYSVTLQQLDDLLESRDVLALRELGGSEGLANALNTDLRKGIHFAEEADRQEQFGKNEYPKKPMVPLWKLFLEAIQDPLLIVLLVLAVVSIVLGVAFPEREEDRPFGWIEGFAIVLAVLIVSTVASVNDWQKERKFRELSKESEDIKIKVVRDGETSTVQIGQIVVGDIVEIEQGDQVPADGVICEYHDLKTDESVMTGETDLIKKNDEAPFLLSGTVVSEGYGRMLVTCVGVNSEWGKTLAKITADDEDDKTPLEAKLDDLATLIGKFGVGFAVATFCVLMAGWLIKKIWQTNVGTDVWSWSDISTIVGFVIISVTIVVVAVPEGLPLAVTISLAYSVKKMMKDNNLVRHLSACETMGGATNICSDKTGTLTLNEMRVVKAVIAGEEYLDGLPDNTDGMHTKVVQVLSHGISVNSKASLNKPKTGSLKEYEVSGNKTEASLLILLKDLGIDYVPIRKHYTENDKIEKLYTFSSAKKRMAVIVKTDEGAHRLYLKGASEIVLGLCTSQILKDGSVSALSESEKKKWMQDIENMASQGLRTLTLAYKDLRGNEDFEDQEAIENGSTLIAIVGIKDPLRTMYQIDDILPRLQVMARSSPTDKFKLVKRLRALGEVVAVTGDGTNDGPALKEADVGLSMGIAGTQIAKEASDIIIMDDNFSSIIKSVLWGRTIYENIRKFLVFQLTVNVCALLVTVITALTSFIISPPAGSHSKHMDPPLTAIQLLWVNLIMDTFAALALATEPPIPELLDRKPYGRNDGLITKNMWIHIIGQGLYQLVVLLGLYYTGYQYLCYDGKCLATAVGDYSASEVNNTIVFNAFVFCQLFNELNSRKINNEWNIFESIHKSWMFIVIFFFTGIMQAIIVQFCGRFTNTVPLNWYQWLVCIVLGILCIPFSYILRVIGRICVKYFKI
ncbi:P-type II calcium ATPase [Naegleria gruberi]|uniref:Calcium-transporting ATPase n=1 Tax=Naegleria gruberi TaxID=5762 RepID=D2VCT4_NAEGR|nr:P-type II calcium ATPase [Naegleria gruberi]EFC45475.1 P-type II calcium ATPase [Naegleria gruberi]|eukprot:XP_002678219.1 P-type II calcium ATPase [Naegleria gruberi strain NEG-M]